MEPLATPRAPQASRQRCHVLHNGLLVYARRSFSKAQCNSLCVALRCGVFTFWCISGNERLVYTRTHFEHPASVLPRIGTPFERSWQRQGSTCTPPRLRKGKTIKKGTVTSCHKTGPARAGGVSRSVKNFIPTNCKNGSGSGLAKFNLSVRVSRTAKQKERNENMTDICEHILRG